MREFQVGSACGPANAPAGRILFGSWNGEDVVVVKTSDERWEIHCHGGSVAVSRICKDLESAGLHFKATSETFGESLEQRIATVTNAALLQCRTRKAAGLVLAQQDGRLFRFAEELESESEDRRRTALEHLERWRVVADHLTRPWRVAIVGEPNVGKSSLINAIAGLQRSIVSETPGTTRDLVEVDVVIRGWMFQFIDTAGIRAGADSLPEQLGIVQSQALLHECDMVCLVVEATREGFEATLIDRLKEVRVPVCIVRNKCDILGNFEKTGVPLFASTLDYVEAITGRVNISAQTGFGISELLAWITKTAVPEEPAPGTVLPFSELFGTGRGERIHRPELPESVRRT
ncbi:MAG: GTPase [Planctomycetaceae bacterium]